MRVADKKSGFTLIELVIVITILGILAAVAIPRFASFRSDALSASEDGVVGAVRSALAIYRADKEVSGATDPNWPNYPAVLDDATNGQASSTNKFFTKVLDSSGQVTDSRWSKSGLTYTGPAGNSYTYDNTNGTFE